MRITGASRFSLLILAAMVLGGSAASSRADELSTLLSDNQSLTSDALSSQRGGNENSQSAVVQDNYVGPHSITGTNSVTGNAFSNAQGLMNVLQNSGNNVSIQSQITVNANIH